MPYIERFIDPTFKKILERNKSIMLVGPRQTGKMTLVEQLIKTDLSYYLRADSYLVINYNYTLERSCLFQQTSDAESI